MFIAIILLLGLLSKPLKNISQISPAYILDPVSDFWKCPKKGFFFLLKRIFTHGPRRWNHGSTDGLFLLLLLLLLPSPSSPSSPSPSSPSHHQICVSLRYRKHQFSNWFDFPGNSSDSYLFLLLLLLFPGVFLSGELSTPVWRTVHRLQAFQCTIYIVFISHGQKLMRLTVPRLSLLYHCSEYYLVSGVVVSTIWTHDSLMLQ